MGFDLDLSLGAHIVKKFAKGRLWVIFKLEFALGTTQVEELW